MELDRRDLFEYFTRLSGGAVLLLRELPTPTPTPPPVEATATPTPPPGFKETAAGVEESDSPDNSKFIVPDYLNPKQHYLCTLTGQYLAGKVSFYSRAGCLGCSKDFKMANGVLLDDRLNTIACNQLPLYTFVQSDPSIVLNTPVRLTNLDNGLFVYAWVTDRGSFEPRIADITIAIRDSLRAVTDESKIKIEQLAVLDRLF